MMGEQNPPIRIGNEPAKPQLTNAEDTFARPDLVLARRHLRIGWWSLLAFLTLGIVLETMHGFKFDFYLNVKNETRRLMWTLAHAHGTLLSLIQIVFGFTLLMVADWNEQSRAQASACLCAATVLLPSGFFLGGIVIHSGDPGLGILLVPVGALFLLTAVWLTARAVTTNRDGASGKR